jgi:hypothetical protein
VTGVFVAPLHNSMIGFLLRHHNILLITVVLIQYAIKVKRDLESTE